MRIWNLSSRGVLPRQFTGKLVNREISPETPLVSTNSQSIECTCSTVLRLTMLIPMLTYEVIHSSTDGQNHPDLQSLASESKTNMQKFTTEEQLLVRTSDKPLGERYVV
jgi:hypothetical protein